MNRERTLPHVANTQQRSRPTSYTITMAKQDIDHLGQRAYKLEDDIRHLRDEVDQAVRDEWRALKLVHMLTARVNMMEEMILLLTSADGKKYLTHEIINKQKGEKNGV